MRFSFAALLTLVLATSAAAQQSARVSLNPPNPTDRTGVTVRVNGTWPDGTAPRCATSSVAGNTIIVTLSCRPDGGVQVPTNFSVETTTLPLPAGRYDIVVFSGQTTIARSSVTVRGAVAPFRIEPDVAFVDGGETVRITGPGVGLSPSIRIGGVNAPVVRNEGPDSIVVRVPAHAAGVVDVSVLAAAANFTYTAAFYYYGASGIPDPAFFEPVLFPVIYNGPGPFGAQWDTELTLRNSNDYSIAAPNNLFTAFCFPGCAPSPAADTTYLVVGQRRPDGRLEYYPRHAMPRLNFNSVVRDISRTQNLGAEVPVLRETDLYDGPFTIANVPAEPDFRISLRLYDIAGPSTVAIRIATINNDFDVVNTTRTLEANETGAASLLIADLAREFPAIANRGPLEIEITPVQPSGRTLWGFVSLTSNVTNQVTVVSPH
jgi:hypothetical protein